MANDMVKYESAKGDLVEFTAEEVKSRLCPNIEDKELALVMALCQAQHLNPFTKDVYITKYGSNPAQIVTGKEVFTKRAQANPKFEGMEAGISVIKDGKLIRREGSMTLPGETLFGGWCKVYIKGYRVPMFDEVAFAEYAGRKKDGTLNSMWNSKGATMIRKVAVCHALREAFPDDFQGLYGSEEMGVEELGEKAQDPTAEAATAPQSGIAEPIVVDAVEVVSDEMAQEILDKAMAFALLRNKTCDDVIDVLIGENAPEQQRADSVEELTVAQGNEALSTLCKWIEKAKEEQEEAELADEDITF